METEQAFSIRFLGETVFSGTHNRLTETLHPTIEGAQAALETFYHALNGRLINLFRQIWFDDPLIQMDNPLGGIRRGTKTIIYQQTRLHMT